MNVVKRTLLACLLVPFMTAHSTSIAQTAAASKGFPDKPITLVVPYPAGGSLDVVARLMAQKMQDDLKVPILVNNRGGASTALGASFVARAPADGYTLMFTAATTFVTNPHLYKNLPYSQADFVPVGLVASLPFAFVVRKDFPASDLKGYVAYGQLEPGKLNNATDGQGTVVHILGELTAEQLKVPSTQVHYRGSAPSITDLMGGQVDSNVQALTVAIPNVRAGSYRALAVYSEKRSPMLPDVPTFAELGYPDIKGDTWFAMFAPAGTDPTIVSMLNASLNRVTQLPAFKDAMLQAGNEPRTGSPEQLGTFVAEQSGLWGERIERMGITIAQ